jgi:HK97 family phage major capsid protein
MANMIDRAGATALMPEDFSREIIKAVPEQSAVMQIARRLPNMTGLVTAGFVTGDTGQKTTTNAKWKNVYINAEELAVIVPIPENVIEDNDYDIWGELQPDILAAIGAAVDAAILFGTNAPSDWPSALLTGTVAASQTVDHSAVAGDYYDEILGEVGTMAMVEADGYQVTGHVAALAMKSGLRGLRDTTGQPIFLRSMATTTTYELDGSPVIFPANGGFDGTQALMFSGDWSQLVFSMRQDITYKILTEATLQDDAGEIIYNLAQQDMIALRAKMRLGWALPNPVNRTNSNDTTRYPFAVLVP